MSDFNVYYINTETEEQSMMTVSEISSTEEAWNKANETLTASLPNGYIIKRIIRTDIENEVSSLG